MSIKLMNAAWEADIQSGRKFVLMSLCDQANDVGECFPSISTIARRCSMSERAVQGHIKGMEADGILTRKERLGRSTIYHINPGRFCTPAENTPPQNLHPTPAESAPTPPQISTETPAESAPITIEPPKEPPMNHEECFQTLWKSFSGRFGERGSRAKAESEFKKIKPDRALFTEMIGAVDYQHRVKEAQTQAGAFCSSFKHVERWLRDKRWKDDDELQQAGPPQIMNNIQDRSWAGE